MEEIKPVKKIGSRDGIAVASSVLYPFRKRSGGFSLVGLILVLAYLVAMSNVIADIFIQRHSLGDTRFLPLDETRSKLRAHAGIQVIRWEVAHDPVFVEPVGGSWCNPDPPDEFGDGRPQRAPYTQWRYFDLDQSYRESEFRIKHRNAWWSWVCNPTLEQVLTQVQARFCGSGGCPRGRYPGEQLHIFFHRYKDAYQYTHPWWRDKSNSDCKDTISNYASGGGNDNGGRTLRFTNDPASWYYDQGYCATPAWKRRGWEWNPYYRGAWGGSAQNYHGAFYNPGPPDFHGLQYRTIAWSLLGNGGGSSLTSLTILSGAPWVNVGWDGYKYSRADSGFTMHHWIEGGSNCQGGNTTCSLVNKGWGTSNISYGMFLNSAANQVQFRLNFQNQGLKVLSLPYTWNADTDWHYLAGTYDYASGIMNFYTGVKGGVLQSTSLNVGSDNLVANGAPIGISWDAGKGTRYGGYISELRIANYAVDADEPAGQDQINHWYTHTTSKRHLEQEIAGGCTIDWRVDSSARFNNWF